MAAREALSRKELELTLHLLDLRVERFYPDYYTAPRPQPAGIPATISYGGNYFDIQLSSTDVGALSNLDNTKVVLIRPGFR